MAAPAQTGQGRLRPLEPRPRPPVSHQTDRPVSQGRALSARPDRPKRTRPTHCAWILHALRCAGAGTYRRRWTALPRKTLPAKFSSFPPKPALARQGRNPSVCAIPAPTKNQRTILQDCNHQTLFCPLSTSTSTSTYYSFVHNKALEASSPGLLIASYPWVPVCLALSLLPPR